MSSFLAILAALAAVIIMAAGHAPAVVATIAADEQKLIAVLVDWRVRL